MTKRLPLLSSERNGLERNYYVVDEQAKKIVKVLSQLKIDT